jgi:hypothetical protein
MMAAIDQPMEATMRNTFFTVAMLDRKTGRYELSRTFSKKAAALKWAKWLRSLGDILETSVYEGRPGTVLIEREAA